MKKILFIICCLLLPAMLLSAQDNSLFEKHWFTHNGDTLPYRLLLPKDYNPNKKYPLVFFMHGAGERGNNNEAQLIHGAKLFLRDDVRTNYPAIVVFPQCPSNSFWSNVTFNSDGDGKRVFVFKIDAPPTVAMQLADKLLQQLLTQYPVQKKRVYVAGLSMGGMGTFELVARNPKLFAAAVPICGGGDVATASKLTKPKWWVFHGAKDNVVPPMHSQQMVAALQAARAKVKFTLYPNANHNSWDPAFAEPNLLPWLFAQKK